MMACLSPIVFNYDSSSRLWASRRFGGRVGKDVRMVEEVLINGRLLYMYIVSHRSRLLCMVKFDRKVE
jgi:hypothetical protein